MVSASDTNIKPAAMMVEPVHASIANKTVSAPREDDDSTCGAYLMHIKLLQQVNHFNIGLTLNKARSKRLYQQIKQHPKHQGETDGGFDPLFSRLDHVGKNETHQEQLRKEHYSKESDHCSARAADLVDGLLKAKGFFDCLAAGFFCVHDVFEHGSDYTQPSLGFYPVTGVFERRATFTFLYEWVGLLHQQKAYDGGRSKRVTLCHCNM